MKKNSSRKWIAGTLSLCLLAGFPVKYEAAPKEGTNYKKMAEEFNAEQSQIKSSSKKLPDMKKFKSNPAVQSTVKAAFENGEVIVKFKSTVMSASEVKVSGMKLMKKEKVGKRGAHLYQLPKGKSVTQAVNELKKSKDVLYAEPNYIVSASNADPYYDYLWGLNNYGQYINGYYGTPDMDINAETAWTVTKGRTDVVVAVIDTGVDINHEDLKSRIFVNKNEIKGNNIDDDNNGYVDDVNGWDFFNNDNTVYDAPLIDDHGTHVAGTIAALGDNGIGVKGVAPLVKILPLKFLGTEDGRGSVADAVKAVEYAASLGVKISNNSWGGGGYSYAMYEAIRDSGSLFIAAAGNDGLNNDYYSHFPASYELDNILSVAAVDNQGYRAYFSNYGQYSVDIAAPGVNILSTVPENGYEFYNGTSMATPHVTGVAALLYSKNKSASPMDMKNQIMNSARDLDSMEYLISSGGMADAGRALGIVPDDDVPGASWSGTSISGTLDENTDLNDVYSIELARGQKITAKLTGGSTKDFDLYLFDPNAQTVHSNENIVAYSEKAGNVAESFSYVAPYSGTYYINAYAYKGKGSYKLEVSASGAKAGVYEDTNAMLLYSGEWKKNGSSIASGGSFTSTNKQYSKVELQFDGTGIEYYGKKDPAHGIARVTLDGEVYNVDLYASKAASKQKLFSKTNLSKGPHTLTIEWTGKANRAARKTSTSINVDYLKVIN